MGDANTRKFRHIRPACWLPPVLPFVLYNGAEPWTAARRMSGLVAPGAPWLAPYQPVQGYFLLDLHRVGDNDVPRRNLLRAVAAVEQSRSFEDVLRVREALQPWLRDPRAAELQRAFVDWMRQIAERMAPAGAVVPPVRTLGGMSMSGGERGGGRATQWLREGLEQGLEQQRALLCRQAAARFGDDTAARLAEVLAPIADPERLAEIGDWLVRCETAAGFLTRLDPGSPSR
ncbi:MAG: Rpn family recombination-promoting nuclease/putative transposase [Spirochaetaceae bacterium]|nr:Rpn family recombination-promoting nuclease/putative transposase [Spirochaetaceae bacterium]